MLESADNPEGQGRSETGNVVPAEGRRDDERADTADSSTATVERFDEIRSQESVFILLNLAILAALVVIHVLFQSKLGRPSALIIGLLAGRFAWQVLELVWLQGRVAPLGPLLAQAYGIGAVIVHLAFATTASLASGLEHSHYVVLFVLPTIAAAFRFGWFGTLFVTLIASANTLVEVRVHYANLPVGAKTAETFEAATVVLVYAAVATFVHIVARRLRAKQQMLQRSLSALAATRDRLVEQEKLAAIGRLSAAIAHEVRNPVAMITSAVATAKQCRFEPPVRDEMCGIIETESARLARLTEEFLSYARQKPPQLQATSVRTTLDYVCGLARPRADEKTVKLDVRIDGDFEARFDAFQVHQALLNLALNAVEAAGPSGEVVLSASARPPAGAAICVRNTGAPIAEAIAAQIFEPFFTTKPGGTGLGLAIAANIAAAHGGSLRLVVNEPGRVEFELLLPGHGAHAPDRIDDGTHPDC
jgi:two-component system sensor histidine kinase HydH